MFFIHCSSVMFRVRLDRGLLHHLLMPKTMSDSPLHRHNEAPAQNQPEFCPHFSHDMDMRHSWPRTMPKYGLVCLKNKKRNKMPWLPSPLLPRLSAAWMRSLHGAAHHRRQNGFHRLCGPHTAQCLQGERCLYSDVLLPHRSHKVFPMVLKSSLRARISAKPTKSWRA